MRLATWNVNSLKARLPRVEEWLAYAQPDVCCLQETKLANDAFPHLTFSALGYDAAHHGEGRWNGVAILSRVGLADVSTGFAVGGADGAGTAGVTGGEGAGPIADAYEGDARVLAATCGGVRVVSVYVPNGREVGTDFYARKLEWLASLRDWLAATASPDDPVAVLGDFNVAPEDRDVWSPKAFEGATHVTAPERDAVAAVKDWGFVDAFRLVYPDDGLFTYWDYRRGDFHQHRGMRIDLVLVTAPVAKRVTWALVDRNARKGQQPSDHAPVVVDLAD